MVSPTSRVQRASAPPRASGPPTPAALLTCDAGTRGFRKREPGAAAANGAAAGDGGADAPGAPVDGPPIDAEEVARFDIPSSRDGRPSDTAEAALLICSDRGSYINGTNLLVDGGLVAGGFRMDI